MVWAIAWTAGPGLLRFANYAFFLGSGTTCHSKCLNLLTPSAPLFCDIVSFQWTQCGIGYHAVEVAMFVPWVFSCILWMLWGFGHWEITIGNTIGFLLELSS